MSPIKSGKASPDLLVIGSSGAAMAAAIAAREASATVALVEQGVRGGTCVNVGRVPSKHLLRRAAGLHAALAWSHPGVAAAAAQVDLAAVGPDKDELVAELRQAKYAEVAKALGFEVVGGSAWFTGPDRLKVNGRPMSAAAYLIATGAEPAVPPLAGLDAVEPLTSATAMDLRVLPRSVVVVGGGYVGLEQAETLSDLGAEVTVVGRVAPVRRTRNARRAAAVLRRLGDHRCRRARWRRGSEN